MTAIPDKIFLIGFMGVGKSHWGSRLAHLLQYPFVELDEEVSQAAGGRGITEIFEQEGEEFFRELESACLLRHTESPGRLVMACGGGTPCFLNNLYRMKRSGKVIWLQADPDELMPRLLDERQKRPLIKHLDEQALRSYILRKMGDRRLYYQQAHHSVAENALNDDNLVKRLLHE